MSRNSEDVMLAGLECEPQDAFEEHEASRVAREATQEEQASRPRRLLPWMGGAVAGAAAALLLAFSLIFPLSKVEHSPATLAQRVEPGATADATVRDLSAGDVVRLPAPAELKLTVPQRAELAAREATAQLPSNLESPPAPPSPSSNRAAAAVQPPMIRRTAQITVTAANLDTARTAMDQIVQRYGGYVGDLAVAAPSDGARRLTANLRVPAAQMDAALAEMKKLGRVESESQSGQDVTAQYVDLEARLSNARNTEQRLLDLLRRRTGKLSDVLEVETELGRVREEVERMEGERRLLSKQVEYSTIAATFTEEYKTPARALPESTGMRFRNAAIDGYQSAVNFVIDVALFLLSDGLLILLWIGILFFPARWAWRKLRARLHRQEQAHSSAVA